MWDIINKVSSIVTIVTGGISVILLFSFNKLKRDFTYKKILKNKNSNKEGVLIINVGKNDIENQVKLWIGKQKKLKINDDDILKVEKMVPFDGSIKKGDIKGIIAEINKKKTEFQHKGISTIHLFMSCPITISTMVGWELKNTFVVYVYQYTNNLNNEYEVWTTLQK